MIVDCHTHVWESSSQMGLGPARLGLARRGPGAQATPGRHAEASQPVDVSLVLGFRSLALGAHVGAPFVASYVRQHPDRLVGFAGLDPTDLNQAMDEMLEAKSELGLGGVTVSPAVQQIHPAHTQAMQLYAEATRLALPVIFDDAAHRMVGGRMEFARPVLLDEIATALPNLRMVVAHMGYPWVEETAATKRGVNASSARLVRILTFCPPTAESPHYMPGATRRAQDGEASIDRYALENEPVTGRIAGTARDGRSGPRSDQGERSSYRKLSDSGRSSHWARV